MSHPALDALLSYRDDPSDEAVGAHLAACPACAAELARVREVRDQLRALPRCEAPPTGWALLSEARQRWRRRAVMVRLALAVAAAVVVWLGLGLRLERAAPSPSAAVESLRQRSRSLEVAWRDQRDAPLDSDTAVQLFELEDVLSAIDDSLSHAEGREEEILWRARVQTLETMLELSRSAGAYVSL